VYVYIVVDIAVLMLLFELKVTDILDKRISILW